MNIDGLISRATHTSGRSLLILSTAVIFGSLFAYPLCKFPLIATAEDMPEKMVVVAALCILVFITFTHFLNWYNDVKLYQASFPLAMLKKYEQERAQTDTLGVSNSERGEDEYVWTPEHKRISESDRAQKISLFGQHFAAPALAVAWAIGVLVYSLAALPVEKTCSSGGRSSSAEVRLDETQFVATQFTL